MEFQHLFNAQVGAHLTFARRENRELRFLRKVVGWSLRLKAIVHEAEDGGFWSEVPALPGCFTQGESIKELEANIHEAIEGWLLAAEPADEGAGGRILEVAV